MQSTGERFDVAFDELKQQTKELVSLKIAYTQITYFLSLIFVLPLVLLNHADRSDSMCCGFEISSSETQYDGGEWNLKITKNKS